LTSRFASLRVRPSHRDTFRAEPWPEEWLLIEWPDGEKEPTKYWMSTLPADAQITALVDIAKLRRRIERDFQDLKQEIGLDHYEGRGWRGLHHHAALPIAAYGFLVAERSPIPPQPQSSARSKGKSPSERRAGVRAAPLRPERHTPNSISTIRRLIATAIASRLPRCP
jgi:SRSO17 transposase